ncbi:hypothetical protein PFISCL1PPCAC_22096, partial [Pristionchus fissidentatus]
MAEEAGTASLRICLICTMPIQSSHYGIDACRACANFFKRAKDACKTYTCRAGDRKCSIVKDEKFMCRSCRFDRCVAAGMIYQRRSTKMENDQVPSLNDGVIGPSTSRDPEKFILHQIARHFNDCVARRSQQELQQLQGRDDTKLAPHPTRKIYLSSHSSSAQLFYITM